MDGGRSDPRNTILHQMFSYVGFGERAGSGLYMIKSTWKSKNWLEPILKEDLNPNRVTLTLYTNDVTNKLSKPINNIQSKILEIIRLNPSISVKEISKIITTVKYDSIRWNISQLKKKEILEHIGTKKGKWIIH